MVMVLEGHLNVQPGELRHVPRIDGVPVVDAPHGVGRSYASDPVRASSTRLCVKDFSERKMGPTSKTRGLGWSGGRRNNNW